MMAELHILSRQMDMLAEAEEELAMLEALLVLQKAETEDLD